jgi:ATP-dependent Clp protease protease subunit
MSMRDALDSLHERGVSLATRTIVLTGDVDEKMSVDLYKNLNILQQRQSTAPITIVINSDGGDVQQALAIYDLIQLCDSHITTIAYGSAQSSACVILQAGDLRKAYPSSIIMYHQGSTSVGETPTNEVVSAFSHSQAICKMADDIIYGRMKTVTGWTRARFNKALDAGIYLAAPRAVELGLIDEVIT